MSSTGGQSRGHEFGKEAEDAAAEFVSANGMRVIKRNLRGPGGEIDIVALDGNVVAFIEVKARNARTYGSALGAVDVLKRRRIAALAADYLQIVAPRARARFDVVTVEASGMRLHRGAFECR